MSIRQYAVSAALLLSGALAAGAAQAGPNVHWQVTVETPTVRLPGNVVLPLPPILVPRAVSVGPRHEDRGYREPRAWDADGDGLPNRYDRTYNPRWDRDGDGVPNRYDPYPNHARNGRGWHGHDGWRHDRPYREERYDGHRHWRDDHRH